VELAALAAGVDGGGQVSEELVVEEADDLDGGVLAEEVEGPGAVFAAGLAEEEGEGHEVRVSRVVLLWLGAEGASGEGDASGGAGPSTA
jgi:hypothetical protein